MEPDELQRAQDKIATMQARAGGVDELLQSGVLEGVGGDTDSHSPGFGATITRFLPTSFRNAFSLAFLRATPG